MDEKSKKTVTMEQVLESARQAEALAIQIAEAVQVELETKQDKLTGTQGQVVGFDANGHAVPVDNLVGDIASILDALNGEVV